MGLHSKNIKQDDNMVHLKVCFLVAFASLAVAAPQLPTIEVEEEFFNPNPKYTYSYQVASDAEQTYIAHQESREDDQVNGEYSYVDPFGSLITVVYTAGPMGYSETRTVTPNQVEIRRKAQPAPAPVPTPAPVRPVLPVRPVQTIVEQVRPVVEQVVEENSAGAQDTDLVARIIAQLTPFIRNTVSSSLSSGGSSSSSVSSVPVTQLTSQSSSATRVPVTPVAVPVPVRVAVDSGSAAGQNSLQGIFGLQGENNVRVETPDFNFAYDLDNVNLNNLPVNN